MALPLRGRTAGHFHPAAWQPADAGAFPALAARLDIQSQPDAQHLAGCTAPGLLAPLVGIVKTRTGPLKCGAVVTGVQAFAGGRGVGHGADEIAQAQLNRVDTALAGRHLDQALHQQGRLRAPGPAVYVHRRRIRHGGLRGNVDAAHQVRPGQNACGIARRHHGAESQPSANGEIHVGLQVHKAALRAQPQLAFQQGAAPLCGRGELFRAGRGPFHAGLQMPRHKGDDQVFRRHRGFGAKGTAHVGRDHAHLCQRQTQGAGYVGARPRRGLR